MTPSVLPDASLVPPGTLLPLVPTVNATGELGRRIRESELKADNGYNTYRRAGLPARGRRRATSRST